MTIDGEDEMNEEYAEMMREERINEEISRAARTFLEDCMAMFLSLADKYLNDGLESTDLSSVIKAQNKIEALNEAVSLIRGRISDRLR